MGGVVWSQTAHPAEATHTSRTSSELEVVQDADASDDVERKTKLDEDMRKFKEEMDKKREARKEAIQNLNRRILELQEERDRERQEKMTLREELRKKDERRAENTEERTEGDNCENRNAGNKEPSGSDKSAQEENEQEACNLGNRQQVDRHEEGIGDEHDKNEVIEGLERQVKALKDVAVIGGEMLRTRELQVNELKSKLEAIEETGVAYEKEVENMKKLRNLYEERARAMKISHEMELEREKQKTLAAETRQKIAERKNFELEERNKETEERMGKIEKELDEAKVQIGELKVKLAGKNEDLYSATSQLAVVNHLFGQLFSPGQDSLEKITKVLEEHHDLVNHLTANGKINELASTLVDIADKDPLPAGGEGDMSGHLTKVWRLLVELLGHHFVKTAPEEVSPDSCYKSVDTPSGPKQVISVSQTFLRLKDLILEKNSLMKEVGRLKDLNSTLESRLSEQENRLSLVRTELHTTWAVVNKLKRQHQNLHSHEQVLRYELAQKRLLLNDLKKQLEECKDNWTLAREKNTQTEKDWRLLRSEFALRKQQASSAESGYEESPTDSQDEEEWKEEKNVSVSSEDEPCGVLSWNDAEEPRAERRGTLTNVSQDGEAARGFMDFSADDVDPCTVLPWTDQEESSARNSVSEDCRHLQSCGVQISPEPSRNHLQLEDTEATRDLDLQESATEVDLASRLGGQSVATAAHSGVLLADGELSRLARPTTSASHLSCDTAATSLPSPPEVTTNSGFEPESHVSTHSRLSEVLPSTSNPPSTSGPATGSQSSQRTAEEILQARQDRLRRLEEGCKGLFNKMSQTNQRSEVINSRLTELHEIYGEDSRAPRESPLPEVREPCSEADPELTSEPEPTQTSANPRRTVSESESVASINMSPPPPPFPTHPLYLPQPPSTTSHPPVDSDR